MAVFSPHLLSRLDKAKFGKIQVWEFSFRSLFREYAWLFLIKAVVAHPVKAARGISRYRRIVRAEKPSSPEYVRFHCLPEEADFLRSARARKPGPLIGLGFCLKPYDPDDPSRSCPSGRANHDCLYFERGETRPVCAGCAITDIGRRALEAGCPAYIMTSAKDIARDFMIPQISRDSFPAAILLLCPYSIQAIILPLLICGVQMTLLSYASGSCADYGQWLKADWGIKEERTTIDAQSQERLLGLLGKLRPEDGGRVQSRGSRRFHRGGNIFYPSVDHPHK